jgi:TP901 family phage tail tape measure protein
MASTADLEAGKAFVRLYLKNDMSRKLVGVLRGAQSQLKKLGQSAMTMGRQLTFAGTAMTAPFALGAKTFADFDDAMRKVQARSHGSARALEDIRKQAKLLGQDTVFTAVEVANLQAILGRRRFGREDILKQTPGIVAFARGAGEGVDLFTDLEDAATLTTGALNAWNLGADQAGRVGDLMTAAVNNSALSMYSLGESMGYVAPLAAQAGDDLQATLQVLGELSNVWIEGSRAGTTYRRMMLNLATEIKNLTGQGIEIQAADGGFRDIGDIIRDIDKATQGLGKVQRVEFFEQIFGARAVTGGVALAKVTEGTLRLREALDNAEGTAKRTADTMDAGLGGEFRRLHSVVERVKIAIGDALAPGLQKLVKRFIEATKATVEWIGNNKGLIVSLSGFATGTIALGVALFGIGVAIQIAAYAMAPFVAIVAAAVTTLGLMGSAVIGLFSPLGIVVTALAGGTVSFFSWSESGQDAIKRLLAAFEEFSQAVSVVINDFTTAWPGVAAALSAGELEAALAIATTTMQLAWARMIEYWMVKTVDFRDKWREITAELEVAFADAVKSMRTLWEGFVTSLEIGQDALEYTVGWIVGILTPGVSWKEMGPAVDEDIRRRKNPAGSNAPPSSQEDQAVMEDRGVEKARGALDAAILAQKAAIKAAAQVVKAAEVAKWHSDFNRDWDAQQGNAGGGGAAAGPPPAAIAAAIPTGIALTATYSAAAASIGGYQAGGGVSGPEEKILAATLTSAQTQRRIANSIETNNEIMAKAADAANSRLQELGTKAGEYLASLRIL